MSRSRGRWFRPARVSFPEEALRRVREGRLSTALLGTLGPLRVDDRNHDRHLALGIQIATLYDPRSFGVARKGCAAAPVRREGVDARDEQHGPPRPPREPRPA